MRFSLELSERQDQEFVSMVASLSPDRCQKGSVKDRAGSKQWRDYSDASATVSYRRGSHPNVNLSAWRVVCKKSDYLWPRLLKFLITPNGKIPSDPNSRRKHVAIPVQ